MGRISNTKILSALLSAGSVRKAAALANCSETTIRERLKDPGFREQYENEKAKILSETCDAITARLTLAADTLCDILEDPATPATVKVSASDALLRHGLRYIETSNVIARLDKLEAAQREATQEASPRE